MLFSSLNFIPACLTAMGLYLYPVFVSLYMIIFMKENGQRQIAALVMAFSGTAMMVWAPGIYVNLTGVLLAVLAAVCYSVYIVLLGETLHGRLTTWTPIVVSACIVSSSAVTMSVVGFSPGQIYSGMTLEGWAGGAYNSRVFHRPCDYHLYPGVKGGRPLQGRQSWAPSNRW